MAHYKLRRPMAEDREQSMKLLKLPTEISNAIHKLVVGSPTSITPLHQPSKRCVVGLEIYDNTNQVQPSIAMVSRQLLSEALSLYYSENMFDLRSWAYRTHRMSGFKQIGNVNPNYIQSVALINGQLKVNISSDKLSFQASFTLRHWDTNRFVEPSEEQVESIVNGLKEDGECADLDSICSLHLINIAERMETGSRRRGSVLQLLQHFCNEPNWA